MADPIKCDTCSRKTTGQCTCCQCAAAGKALFRPSWDIREPCMKCGLQYSPERITALRTVCKHYAKERATNL